MAEKIRDGKVRCSFCHKSEDQVRKLIAGPEGVFICDECIGICSEIMEEELGDYDQEDIYDTDAASVGEISTVGTGASVGVSIGASVGAALIVGMAVADTS